MATTQEALVGFHVFRMQQMLLIAETTQISTFQTAPELKSICSF